MKQQIFCSFLFPQTHVGADLLKWGRGNSVRGFPIKCRVFYKKDDRKKTAEYFHHFDFFAKCNVEKNWYVKSGKTIVAYRDSPSRIGINQLDKKILIRGMTTKPRFPAK